MTRLYYTHRRIPYSRISASERWFTGAKAAHSVKDRRRKMSAAVSAPPAFPSRGGRCAEPCGAWQVCSNLPFHASLLHRPFSRVAAQKSIRQNDWAGLTVAHFNDPPDNRRQQEREPAAEGDEATGGRLCSFTHPHVIATRKTSRKLAEPNAGQRQHQEESKHACAVKTETAIRK